MQWLKLLAISLLFSALLAQKSYSQPVPVGSFEDEQYRMLQLLSDADVETSLTSRPIWNYTYRDIFTDDNIREHTDSWWANPLENYERKITQDFYFGFYDPVFTNTFNTELPLGDNNGAAWYGKGVTSEFQTGFYVTSKYVTASFRPHFIYAQNKDFRTPHFIPRGAEGNPHYTAIFPNIDMPFRFGPDSYTDFNLGHSSIRLHYKSIEGGLSTEPLWWGPGIQNALTLSNNAPGLKHAFLGSRSPLNLPLGIGNIEFKFIWAQPEDSQYFPADEDTDQNRFTTGLNLSFSPGFAPNLNVGFTRILHNYIPENGLTTEDFLATFYKKPQTGGDDSKNQLVSLFFRWIFPESNAEVYGELFREDAFYNARDLFMEPDHSRAFTIGFQKIVEHNGWFRFFKINGEINSLVPNRTDEVRPQVHYYSHTTVTQGHTNEGQVLGAAIGPGSASQYLGMDGYFKKGNIGIFIQRVAKNDFFHFEFYDFFYFFQDPDDFYGATATKDIYRHRINLNIGINGRYKIGPLLLSGKVVWNKNYNYGRFNYGELEGINFDTVEKDDLVNLQFQLSARYYFDGNFLNE